MRSHTLVNAIIPAVGDGLHSSDIGMCASGHALASAIILKQFDRDSPERHALLRKRWQAAPGSNRTPFLWDAIHQNHGVLPQGYEPLGPWTAFTTR